jgi:ATP-dependent 26S proteasome regulatory subunit
MQEIETLIRAKYPILYIVSWEERRVEEAVRNVCNGLKRNLYTWTVTGGIKPEIPRSTVNSTRTGGLPGELEVLAQIHQASENGVFLLKDFHPYLKDYRVVRLLRDLAAKMRGRSQTLIICSPSLTLPQDLEKDVTVLEFPLPTEPEISETLDRAIETVKGTKSVDTDLSPEMRERVVKSAQGLTQDEIESVFARSLVEKKRFDLDAILQEKKQIIRKSGLLEYYAPDAGIADVGGLDLLKEWLDKRTKTFTDEARQFGIPAPKGILLLGVQGCGKSLVAKAVAYHWNLPLLKLDVGRIFGSLVGQSEENIRKAISTAESVSPCVLWADELEKGFAGVGSQGVSDSGTTARVFATFLTWMSEKTKPVFMIATANDISSLPPEMLRKGRFDEIFFVDLPNQHEREQVFTIHLEKRKRAVKSFNIKALAKATDGFSGAEIEQVVVGALYAAFDEGREVEQKDLLLEAKQVVPLSVMMREEIDELRTWAEIRARPATRPEATSAKTRG